MAIVIIGILSSLALPSWNLPMTFTMLRSDVPSSHRIQKPTPHTSLRPNVSTVAPAVVVKVVKAVAVVKVVFTTFLLQ